MWTKKKKPSKSIKLRPSQLSTHCFTLAPDASDTTSNERNVYIWLRSSEIGLQYIEINDDTDSTSVYSPKNTNVIKFVQLKCMFEQ